MVIKNLSFKFNKNSSDYFFNNLTIEFSQHAVHFIQGDNGVGKSTLFNCLCGKIDKNSFLEASIVLEDVTYSAYNNALPVAFTQMVHVVQQDYDSMIASQFTFMQNLQFANLQKYPRLQSLPQATLFDAVKKLGIDVNLPAHLLSGGQRQLLAIFMAFQKPTKVLLLDEPTATLDRNNARMIMDCLYELAAQLKVTILIICHDKELVQEYARGNSFVMKHGDGGTRLVQRG
jgi:ABC-type lipoprotein export system ATPase subunit